jgi:hypothetical protein
MTSYQPTTPVQSPTCVPDADPPGSHRRIPLRREYDCDEQQPEHDEDNERDDEANH